MYDPTTNTHHRFGDLTGKDPIGDTCQRLYDQAAALDQLMGNARTLDAALSGRAGLTNAALQALRDLHRQEARKRACTYTILRYSPDDNQHEAEFITTPHPEPGDLGLTPRRLHLEWDGALHLVTAYSPSRDNPGWLTPAPLAAGSGLADIMITVYHWLNANSL